MQVCGAGHWPDQFASANAHFAHSANSVTIEFRHTLNQGSTDESLGVSRVFIETQFMSGAKVFKWETGEKWTWDVTKVGLTAVRA